MSGWSRPWAASRAVYITPVMRTRSPALSDSTSASVSGVVMSLVPSGAVFTIAFGGRVPEVRSQPLAPAKPALEAPESQRGLFVPVRVAFDSVRGGLDGPLRSLPPSAL